MEIIFNETTHDWVSTSLEEFLYHNTPSGWTDFFNRSDIKQHIHTISNYLRYEASHDAITIYPSINNVFRALYSIDINGIDLIIVGQDPYHNGAATGLAFDVAHGHKLNPSLRNIIKELDSCGFETSAGLTRWPEQGILMINTALTVRKGCPDSHTEIWSTFTTELIQHICQIRKQLIWLLMGTYAQSFAKDFIKSSDSSQPSHIVIKTTHPSPLSATKSTKRASAFIGSQCFLTINEKLIRIGKEPIKF